MSGPEGAQLARDGPAVAPRPSASSSRPTGQAPRRLTGAGGAETDGRTGALDHAYTADRAPGRVLRRVFANCEITIR